MTQNDDYPSATPQLFAALTGDRRHAVPIDGVRGRTMREAKVVLVDIGGGPGREILAFQIGDWYAAPIPRYGWCVGNVGGRAFHSPQSTFSCSYLTWEQALELAGRFHDATGMVGADYDRAQVDAVIRQWRKERGV